MLFAAAQTVQDTGAVETIRDLGIPTLVGAVLGALIAHYTAKARVREEHQKSLERLRINDERAHAREALTALREIRERRIHGKTMGPREFAALWAEWSDRVGAPMRLIKSDALERRVRATSYLLFLGTLKAEDPATYAALVGMRDVEAAVEAWLRDEVAPPPGLPTEEQIREMVKVENSLISLEPLKEWFANR